jgi:hypothetical protein
VLGILLAGRFVLGSLDSVDEAVAEVLCQAMTPMSEYLEKNKKLSLVDLMISKVRQLGIPLASFREVA